MPPKRRSIHKYFSIFLPTGHLRALAATDFHHLSAPRLLYGSMTVPLSIHWLPDGTRTARQPPTFQYCPRRENGSAPTDVSAFFCPKLPAWHEDATAVTDVSTCLPLYGTRTARESLMLQLLRPNGLLPASKRLGSHRCSIILLPTAPCMVPKRHGSHPCFNTSLPNGTRMTTKRLSSQHLSA